MEEKSNGIRILIINQNDTETQNIRDWLNADMSVPWNMNQCASVDTAGTYLKRTDIIILCPETEGLTRKEVFQDLSDMVFETPIIVLAGTDQKQIRNRQDRGLSSLWMENGAAENVSRAQFSRLADAVEYAMIRQRKATANRKATDRTLADSVSQSAADLQDNLNKRTADKERHRQIVRMFMGDYAVDRAR